MLSPRTALRLARRYLERRVGIRRPIYCSWYVTARCNRRCEGCVFFERFAGEGPELSPDEALDAVDQLGALSVAVLIFVGGEPLLRPDLPQLLIRAQARGLRTALFTNGDPLTPQLAQRISHHLDALIVSLDGLGPGHDGVRGKGSFERAWQGLLCYRDHRARPGAQLFANVGLHRDNLSTVEPLMHELLAVGVDRIKFQPNFIPAYKPDPAEAVALIDRLEALWRQHPQRILGDPIYFRDLKRYFTRDDNRAFCGARSLSHISLLPDGDVSACCDFLVPLGSLRREPLARILARDLERELDRAADCDGCVRRDYQLEREIFARPPWRLRPAALRAMLQIGSGRRSDA